MSFEFVRDTGAGVTVMRDGQPQSHVQPDDPELLAFEYVQHFAVALDVLDPDPITVTHIGGAGLTFARYVQQVRPGTPQVVLEPDAALTEAVRRELPLPRGHRIRVRDTDGRTGLKALRDNSAHLIVLDAYDEGRVPADLTTPACWADIARVLRPGGLLLANIADEPARRYLARVLATMHPAFARLTVVATHDVLKRRRFGNYVVIASDCPIDLTDLRRAIARSPYPTGVLDQEQTMAIARSGRPFTETDTARSPQPPDPSAWRLR